MNQINIALEKEEVAESEIVNLINKMLNVNTNKESVEKAIGTIKTEKALGKY